MYGSVILFKEASRGVRVEAGKLACKSLYPGTACLSPKFKYSPSSDRPVGVNYSENSPIRPRIAPATMALVQLRGFASG
jgi:hypothetical protein